MRNILLAFVLGVAVLGNCEIQAQESEAQSTNSVTYVEDDKGGRISIDIDLDDNELSTDEKFEAAKKAIKATVGEEFGKELELEIDGLSDEEKAKVVSAIEQKFSFESSNSNDGIPAGAIAIALPAIILTLGMPIFIVLLVLWFGHKKRKQKLEIINTYLQANQEVPNQVLNAFDSEIGSNSLRKGILLTGVGLGIFLGFSVGEEMTIAGIGLIPFFMGVARLFYWYIEERKQEASA